MGAMASLITSLMIVYSTVYSTFFALLAICVGNSPVPGEFPTQTPVTRSFDVFFISALNTRLSKQSGGWWFETPSRSLWRHCSEVSSKMQYAFRKMQYTLSKIPCNLVKCYTRSFYWSVKRWCATVTPYGLHGVSNHQQLDCLFSSLFRLMNYANNTEPYPCHGVFMYRKFDIPGTLPVRVKKWSKFA